MKHKRKPSAFINDIPLKYKFLFIYLLCVLVPILSINALFMCRSAATWKYGRGRIWGFR